jgi:hypothetical protein
MARSAAGEVTAGEAGAGEAGAGEAGAGEVAGWARLELGGRLRVAMAHPIYPAK